MTKHDIPTSIMKIHCRINCTLKALHVTLNKTKRSLVWDKRHKWHAGDLAPLHLRESWRRTDGVSLPCVALSLTSYLPPTAHSFKGISVNKGIVLPSTWNFRQVSLRVCIYRNTIKDSSDVSMFCHIFLVCLLIGQGNTRSTDGLTLGVSKSTKSCTKVLHKGSGL